MNVCLGGRGVVVEGEAQLGQRCKGAKRVGSPLRGAACQHSRQMLLVAWRTGCTSSLPASRPPPPTPPPRHTHARTHHPLCPQLLSASYSDHGGVKAADALVSGAGAFGRLRWESGVHRAQVGGPRRQACRPP